MKTFFLSLLGSIVALILVLVLLPVIIITSLSTGSSEPVAQNIVLEINLNQDISDQPSVNGLGAIFPQNSLVDIIRKLDSAERDEAVKGVFIRSNMGGLSYGHAEELRLAIQDFRAADKFVIVHSQGNYSMGPSSWHAISSADEIWIQPGSDVFLSGIEAEGMFYRGLLDKIGFQSEILKIAEYKNAPNVYSETGFDEYHREAISVLINSLWDSATANIMADREIPTETFAKAISYGPKSAELMLELGLADNLGWPEDTRDKALEYAGENAIIMDILEYALPVSITGPVIALVGGEGAIMTGYGDDNPLANDEDFYSDRVASSILEAVDNDRVKAIVFRVDSPGGSAIASDQIWRAVKRAQDADIPVVVSMSNLAASGGYYVSAGADAIFALNSTITGSIGIFGGKFAVSEGFGKIGITFDTIRVGDEFSGAFSAEAFTDTQRKHIFDSLQRGYDRFTKLVAEGRDMSPEAVEEVARGRVWSGQDGLQNGLVDEIGGLMDAINYAYDLVKTEDDGDQPYNVMYFPLQKTPIEIFGEALGGSAQGLHNAEKLNAFLDDPRITDMLMRIHAAQSREPKYMTPSIHVE